MSDFANLQKLYESGSLSAEQYKIAKARLLRRAGVKVVVPVNTAAKTAEAAAVSQAIRTKERERRELALSRVDTRAGGEAEEALCDAAGAWITGWRDKFDQIIVEQCDMCQVNVANFKAAASQARRVEAAVATTSAGVGELKRGSARARATVAEIQDMLSEQESIVATELRCVVHCADACHTVA